MCGVIASLTHAAADRWRGLSHASCIYAFKRALAMWRCGDVTMFVMDVVFVGGGSALPRIASLRKESRNEEDLNPQSSIPSTINLEPTMTTTSGCALRTSAWLCSGQVALSKTVRIWPAIAKSPRMCRIHPAKRRLKAMAPFPLTSISVCSSLSNLRIMVIKQVLPGYSFCGSAYRKATCINLHQTHRCRCDQINR